MITMPVCSAADTDRRLMERVAAGDARAFGFVYDRYHRQAHAHADRLTGRYGGADEVTQDAFLSLWRGAFRFDPDRGSLGAWLHTLVHHRGIDWLRRAKATPGPQIDAGIAERLEAPERTDEQVIALQEFDHALSLVAALPPKQREVIDLAYLAGFSQSEIAARVGAPLGTVKARTRMGLLKLRHAAQLAS
jgi:RNA polymerase sigma-70 factor (ECF subfamily)